MRELLLATFNENKVREITQISKGFNLDIKFLYLKDFDNIKKVTEDGKIFKENAFKKAKEYYSQTGVITLAEDSGLCVDALDGAPGVYSARFSGEEKDDYKNNLKLIHILEGVEEREARFICSAALVLSKDSVEVFEGVLEGSIASGLRGQSGFGYDPVFLPQGYDRTLAELGAEVKNKISHRYRAIEGILKFIKESY
jgi:XTP/dITP diphosphohydrolase